MKSYKLMAALTFLFACSLARAEPVTQPAIQVTTAQDMQRDAQHSISNSARDTIACLADEKDTEMCAASATSRNKKVSPGLYAAHAGFKKMYKRSVGLTGGVKYIVLEVSN